MLGLLVSQITWAGGGGQTGDFTIQSILVTSDDRVVVTANSAFSNPNSCNFTDALIIDRDPANIQYKRMYQLLLLARRVNATVEFQVDGCVSYNDNTYPLAQEMTLKGSN